MAGTGPINLVLPAVTLGVSNAAIVARMTRSSMIDVDEPGFRPHRPRQGLTKALVLNRQSSAPASCRLLTMAGMQSPPMMGGAIVVENIFAWNGVGRLAIEAIFQRDYR